MLNFFDFFMRLSFFSENFDSITNRIIVKFNQILT